VGRYQRGKTNLDFTEARDSEWQWHQVGCMQVRTSLQTDNHASTSPPSFLQAGCPSCRPTNGVEALKAKLPSDTSSDNLGTGISAAMFAHIYTDLFILFREVAENDGVMLCCLCGKWLLHLDSESCKIVDRCKQQRTKLYSSWTSH